MKTREEYIALITSHAEELQNTFGITSLRLFGSVARNQHHDGSDVDIYVEMPLKFFLIVRLKAYLEALLCKGESFEKKPKNLQKYIPNLTLYHTFIKIIELILGHFTEKLYFCLNFNKETTWKITINLWLATNLLTGAL